MRVRAIGERTPDIAQLAGASPSAVSWAYRMRGCRIMSGGADILVCQNEPTLLRQTECLPHRSSRLLRRPQLHNRLDQSCGTVANDVAGGQA